MTTASDGRNEYGSIVIMRRSAVQDVARSHNVFINGIAVGKMWAFPTRSFMVAPGCHDLQLKFVDTGWSCSDVFWVDVAPGSKFVLRTHFRGLKDWLTIPFTMPEGTAALARGEKLESNYYECPWIRIRIRMEA